LCNCSLETGDGGIIITSLGFDEVDSLLSRSAKFVVDLAFKEDVSELDPWPESEVVDSIITSLSLLLFSTTVASISGTRQSIFTTDF
jgi:hypothetical protein